MGKTNSCTAEGCSFHYSMYKYSTYYDILPKSIIKKVPAFPLLFDMPVI